MGSDQLGGGDVPLKLREFRTLYRLLRRGWPDWAAFLLLGFLVWIEGVEGPCRGIQDPIRGLWDYFISVVYFLPRQVKVFFPAVREALNALSKEPLSMPPCVRRWGTAGP